MCLLEFIATPLCRLGLAVGILSLGFGSQVLWEVW